VQALATIRSLLRGVRCQINYFRFFSGVGLIILSAVLGFTLDGWAYDLVKDAGGNSLWEIVAERLSFWGDFLTGTLPLCLGLWVMGYWLKRYQWQRTALACLLAAFLAGGMVSAVRLTAGRTRPNATLENAKVRLGYEPRPIISFGRVLPDGKLIDGFYGIKRPAMFQAFPSGHAATSVATAATLLVALPEIGIFIVPMALGVCWSRMYLHQHHFSDVLVGAAVGLIVGLSFGRGARVEGESPYAP